MMSSEAGLTEWTGLRWVVLRATSLTLLRPWRRWAMLGSPKQTGAFEPSDVRQKVQLGNWGNAGVDERLRRRGRYGLG
jgi:hypothetical protein